MAGNGDKPLTEFQKKLKSINFGTVPGAYRDSNRYDEDALKQMNWPSKEEVLDNRSDVRSAPEKEIKLENQPIYKNPGR